MPRRCRSSRSNRAEKSRARPAVLLEELESRALLSTYTVSNLNASGPGSLWADFQQVSATGGANTINFAAGLSGTITPIGGLELDPAGQTTIAGPGAGLLTINGRFIIRGGSAVATIAGMTIIGGSAGPFVYPASGGGGGIYNYGTLTVQNCTVSGNSATLSNGASGGGGGIYNAGTLTVIDSMFSHNSTISGSGGSVSGGGAIYNSATLTVVGSAFVDNSAGGSGGAIYNVPIGSPAGLTIRDSTFSNNKAGGEGGAIYTYGDPVVVSHCQFAGNSAIYDTGGGIFSYSALEVTQSTFSGNTSFEGAGIMNFAGASLTVSDSTFSGNTSVNLNGHEGGGAGITNEGYAAITNSTISGNTAPQGAGIENPAYPLTLTNCTITGNVATGTGGGIHNGGTLTVVNCTISGNSAGTYQGGGGIANEGVLRLNNTVVAGNEHSAHVPDDITVLQRIGEQVLGSNNLIGTGGSGGLTNGSNGNIVGTIDPKLAPLGNYGGPTQTMPPLPASPAIDHGSNALAVGPNGNPLLTDQRGFTRIFNGTVDIGACESRSFVPGDANLDGNVDFADLVILARNYGATNATWVQGDFDGDGKVDFNDLMMLARNYRRSTAAAAAAINASSTEPPPMDGPIRRRAARAVQR